jgi:hypothetical protein
MEYTASLEQDLAARSFAKRDHLGSTTPIMLQMYWSVNSKNYTLSLTLFSDPLRTISTGADPDYLKYVRYNLMVSPHRHVWKS